MTKNSVQVASVNDLFTAVNNCETLEDAKSLIKRIDALKAALEAVDLFREKAVLYARLEVEALLKVCELGGVTSLRGTHRATAEWLASLSDEDRDRYVSMCSDGCTIDWIYKREVGNEKKLSAQITDIKMRRDWLVDDLNETGFVNIKEFSDHVRNSVGKIDSFAAEALIDGARNIIRKSGGIGIGDDSGIYIKANSGMTKEIESAIKLRVQSIFDDFQSLKDIVRASGIRMSYQDFCKKLHNANTSCGFVVPCLLALCQIGLISNEDEMLQSLASSDASRELSYVKRALGWSREQYITHQYERIQREKEMQRE